MNHWTDSLNVLRACDQAVAWCLTQPDLETAWQTCERGDWMLWLAGRLSGPVGDPRRILLAIAAADCAQPAVDAMREGAVKPASVECLRVTRAWADGAASLDDVRMARQSAAAAACAACAAYADAYAAYADAYAAACAAADAAACAAASYAAYAAYAAAAYAAAARIKSLKKSADICREILTEEVLKKYKNKI